jgi:hypothetical protein
MTKNLSRLLGLLLLASSSIKTGELTGQEAIGKQKSAISDEELTAKAVDAYIYGYPLVLMNQAKKLFINTILPSNVNGHAPINQFGYFPLHDPSFTAIASPNVDTVQTYAWLDLTSEPIVMQIPDSQGRFWLTPILDAYTNVVATPGTRSTGNGAQTYVIVGPNWRKPLRDDLTPIHVPTNLAWILGRTEVDAAGDYAAADAIRRQYALVPLSSYGRPYTQPSGTIDSTVTDTPPTAVVEGMSVETFFDTLAQLMVQNPPNLPDDASILVDLSMVMAALHSPEKVRLLSNVPQLAASRMVAKGPSVGYIVNGWRITPREVGAYGTDYDLRYGVGRVGLGANLAADTVYAGTRVDGAGHPLNSTNAYTIHFAPGLTPPVKAFWSVTLYNQNSSLVANPSNIYAVGSHREPLQYNADGSLDLYLQASPPAIRTANWLPTPDPTYAATLPNGQRGTRGSFALTMRLYWPSASDPTIVDRTWQPPPVQVSAVH